LPVPPLHKATPRVLKLVSRLLNLRMARWPCRKTRAKTVEPLEIPTRVDGIASENPRQRPHCKGRAKASRKALAPLSRHFQRN